MGGTDLTVGTSCCGSFSGYLTLSKPPEFTVFHTVYLSALSPKEGETESPKACEYVRRCGKTEDVTGSSCVST